MVMHRRISEQPRDKRYKRKRNPVLALICEGSDTEPLYFSNFKNKFINIDIQIVRNSSKAGKKTDPINIIKKAYEYKSKNNDILNYKDGDRIWCIFDVDIDYKNHNSKESKYDQIVKTKKLADKRKIDLGISNPCFELWYLLHFEYSTAFLKDYNDVEKRLKRNINSYSKSSNIYPLLKDNTENAIENANRLRKYYIDLDKNLNDPKDIIDCNPYTNIQDLVSYIKSFSGDGVSKMLHYDKFIAGKNYK